jgi:hypothetical protein
MKDTGCAERTIAERRRKDVGLAGSGFHASESIRKTQRIPDALLSTNGKGEVDEHCEGKEHLEQILNEEKWGLVPRGEVTLWESSSARIGRRA